MPKPNLVAIAITAVALFALLAGPINAQRLSSQPVTRLVTVDRNSRGNSMDGSAVTRAWTFDQQDNQDLDSSPSDLPLAAQDDETQIEPPQTEAAAVAEYLRPIGELTINIQAPPTGPDPSIDRPEVMPASVAAPMGYSMGPRYWAPSTLCWQIPDTFRRPLYFEDRSLERCGCNRGYCLQPPISAVKFVWDTAVCPLRKIQLHPRTCIYAQCHRYDYLR